MPRPSEPLRPSEFELSPLAAVAACFALGIAVTRPGPAKLPGVALLLGCSGCLLLGLIALRRGKRTLSFLLALGGFIAAGAIAAQLFEFRFPPNHVSHLPREGIDLSRPVRLEGVVVSTPVNLPYALQFDLEVLRLESGGRFRPASGRVRLRLNTTVDSEDAASPDSLRLQYGDSVRALVQLRRPQVYRNPGAFNFRRWMESIEDLYWVGTIRTPLLMERLPATGSYPISTFLASTRRRLLLVIDKMYPPWSAGGRNGAVLKAVLLGDRSSLDSDTVEDFRKVGLYHLLVIAGLHVGLLAFLAGSFLRLLRVGESWRSLLVLAFLICYASVVEQRAPTLRATLMISAYLAARVLYRGHVALNSVGLAALVLLIYRPPWLFESGFQLSFAAALLIVGLVRPILDRTTEPFRRALQGLDQLDLDLALEPRLVQFRLDVRSLASELKRRFSYLERHPDLAAAAVTGPARAGLWIANMLLFSAVLQLGLLLPMAETFHRVTYAGIGLNALAIPVMTLLLGLAFPTILLSALVPAAASWVVKALSLVMTILFALTDLPHLPQWLSYRVPEPPPWVAWGFALSVIAAAWALDKHRSIFWTGLASLGLFAVLVSLYPFAPRLPRGELEVTSLDCGGGDAVFLVLPNQTTMLVNACGKGGRSAREGAFQGRRWDPGEEIVSPYLWSRGIKKLDFLVATDAVENRLSGLEAVVRNFRVSQFWHGANSPTPGIEALLNVMRERGVAGRKVGAGDRIAHGGNSIEILWPPALPSAGQTATLQSSNLNSVALRISSGESSVILPGDIGDKVEDELAREEVRVNSQVLLVGLHGAKSSLTPEFLARVSPQIAVVSVGRGGPGSQPSPETLNRLLSAGAQVFRTDLDGAVRVELRGASPAVRSYRTSAGDGIGWADGAGNLSVR